MLLDIEIMIDPEEGLCETCGGSGGWDIADDCEVYDEWVDCQDCQGTGIKNG